MVEAGGERGSEKVAETQEDQDRVRGGTMSWEGKNRGLGVTLWLAGMLGRKKRWGKAPQKWQDGIYSHGMEDIEAALSYRRYRGRVPKGKPDEWLTEIWLSNPQNHFPSFFQWPRFIGLISNYVRGYGDQEHSLGIALNQSSLDGNWSFVDVQFGLSQEMVFWLLFPAVIILEKYLGQYGQNHQ